VLFYTHAFWNTNQTTILKNNYLFYPYTLLNMNYF
jgi:hypothetical protein